jgi:Fe(3+) dicitrate transport protein
VEAHLQFGPQFGGMVNYVLKREKKAFTFETQNTVGELNEQLQCHWRKNQ